MRRRARGTGREEGGQQFVGSILLRFRYSTPQRQEEEEVEEEERVDGEEAQHSPVSCVSSCSMHLLCV